MSFLTAFNHVFLGLSLGLVSPSLYNNTCIFSPNLLIFLSLHLISTCFSSEHYQLPLWSSYHSTALVFFSQAGSTHLPNHLLLCFSVLSSIDSCRLHWHCLTSIHHAASDTAPIDFTFHFKRRSFESQNGRQLSELLPCTIAHLTLATNARSFPPSAFSISPKYQNFRTLTRVSLFRISRLFLSNAAFCWF